MRRFGKFDGIVYLVFILSGLMVSAVFAEGEELPSPIPSIEVPDNFNEIFQNPWENLDTSEWPELDLVPDIGTKIVGGSEVSPPNSYPFMVSQQWQNPDTLSKFHFCGGTLIAEEWVLTAAHCWSDYIYDNEGNIIGWGVYIPDENFSVVLGEHSLSASSGNEQIIGVNSVFVHDSYNHITSYGYDIALLHLSSPAILNEYVDTITLIDSGFTELVGTTVTAIEWGDLEFEDPDPPPDELQEVNLEYLADSACSAYGGWFETDSMFCAGIAGGGYGTCQGDSGGPVFYQESKHGNHKCCLQYILLSET